MGYYRVSGVQTCPLPFARRAPPPRRSVVRGLALGLGSGATAWMAWKGAPLESWQAGQRTATGERRDLKLPDGSLVALDTATALDTVFDDRQRVLRLHRGRILDRKSTRLNSSHLVISYA